MEISLSAHPTAELIALKKWTRSDQYRVDSQCRRLENQGNHEEIIGLLWFPQKFCLRGQLGTATVHDFRPSRQVFPETAFFPRCGIH
jgi:hypothetical protein